MIRINFNVSFYLATVIAFLTMIIYPAYASNESIANCSVPSILAQRLQSERIILMGEVHGTVESPAAFGSAVCSALNTGRAVSVGLELYRDQGRSLANFLSSNGSKAEVEKLLRSGFWTRDFQDGRSSRSMLELIDLLRNLKRIHIGLSVFILEDEIMGKLAPLNSTRDEVMARRVRAEFDRRPDALILTLSGNVHSSLQVLKGSSNQQSAKPTMGVLLRDLAPRSVLLETPSGTAWVCAPKCGVHGTTENGLNKADAFLTYRDLPLNEPYTEEWWLGPSTASRPAVEVGGDGIRQN